MKDIIVQVGLVLLGVLIVVALATIVGPALEDLLGQTVDDINTVHGMGPVYGG